YSERCTHRNADYAPFTMGFHPPALTHSDEVGSCGSHMFCIPLRHSFLAQARPFLTTPEFVPDLSAPEATRLSLRLLRDCAADTLSCLQVEELCSDMLERVGCSASNDSSIDSAWLKRALDLLHESYRAPLTLEDVGRQIGIHPIHLSRVFRKRY